MTTLRVWTILLLTILSVQVMSQGLLCEESAPFCTSNIYRFPAGTTGSAQSGPYYDCLSTQPAPAWYHMLIDDPGNINIYMYSTPSVDIDFCCWGPFTDPFESCPYGLNASSVVDCSYSPNPTENCYIPNGQTGEYYILLITNYSQQVCEITFEKTSGSGTTDCTIVPPPVNNNGPLCVGETLELYADTIANASYWWTGPNGFISASQNPVLFNVSLAAAGDYGCTITVNGNSSDPAITSVVIYDKPTLELISNDTIVCIGEPAYLVCNLTGWGPFEVDYDEGLITHTATGLSGPTDTIFVYPGSPTTYTITQVRDIHCYRSILGLSSFVDTYPYTSAVVYGSTSICSGQSTPITVDLSGEGPWVVTYTANGANPQTVNVDEAPYIFNVSPTSSTLYEVTSVEDVNCSGVIVDSAMVNVDPVANVNAGNDQTISFGTSTSLNGQVSGGSGNNTYSWEPAAKLIDPNVLNPTTILLTETTVYTLTAIDLEGNCETEDNVMVTITGGPLGIFPYAEEDVICNGFTTQIFAGASGGSGDYTFSWTSSPAGFTSDIANPVVNPSVNTTYFIAANDGFNTVNGSVDVSVNELPLPDAGADQTIPHGTTTQLSGSATQGSGNYQYQWQPAVKLGDATAQNPNTVNLFSTTLFTLTVTDAVTGCVCGEPSTMTVVISGDALNTNPAAAPNEFCEGQSTQLFALAGGGSGTYTYDWTANNSSWSSSEAEPFVSPGLSTTYSVDVSDGFNATSGSVDVVVNPGPVVDLGPPDTIACPYDSLVLDARNPGASYLWSNGATSREIKVGSSGAGFDSKVYTVEVTSADSCSAEATITVLFDFSACFGVNEHDHFGSVNIYPNPNSGSFILEIENYEGDIVIDITDVYGKSYWNKEISGIVHSYSGKIDLSNVPKGIYLIRLNDEKYMRAMKIIVK